MLHIDKLKKGIVIDHIKAGQGIKIFNWLGLAKKDCTVAFVVNANSRRFGRKDIIKIDTKLDIDFDVLSLIDPQITVNTISNEKVAEKRTLKLPVQVKDVILCKNPRCITSTEKYIPHIFRLENPEQRTYCCEYCDEIRPAGDFI